MWDILRLEQTVPTNQQIHYLTWYLNTLTFKHSISIQNFIFRMNLIVVGNRIKKNLQYLLKE